VTSRRLIKDFIRHVATSPVVRPIGKPLLHGAQYALGLHGREVVSFAQPERTAAARRIRDIVTGWETQTMGVDEAYVIRAAVLATSKIVGDLAEVGVFRGGTARIICEAKGKRSLHLFDTFQGLPQPAAIDKGFEKGQYASSLNDVRRFLAGCSDIHFHEGLFPATAGPVMDHRFSFVHLDVDLYDSTRAALEFFYPRLSPGAVVISHDYVEFAGVRNAFDEFFGNKPEPVLELSGNQCMVVKVAAPE
jgi:O-methyltransferase